MFKSCQYCRHRKKRCVFPPSPSHDGRCLACQQLGVTCEVAPRQPSLKRQRTSQRISAQVAAAQASSNGADRGFRDGDNASGDCQLPGRDGSHRPKELLLPSTSLITEDISTTELYEQVVHSDFPFVAAQYLEGSLSPLLVACIELAGQMSFRSRNQGAYDEHESYLANALQAWDLDLPGTAGFLLLLPRITFGFRAAEKVFQFLLDAASHNTLPRATEAGALATHTWLSLLGQKHPKLPVPNDVLLEYATELDESSFGNHFLKLSHLAASLADLLDNTQSGDVETGTVNAWACIEHATLLNVAKMRSEFLDVRDEMPATPAAVITHMLQNLIYLRLYHYMLCENKVLGEALALRPIPGVLHFICAITRSTFICQPQILQYWPLVSDIQAVAAQMMLDLWSLTKFENCRALLNLWKPPSGHDDLVRAARECTGSGPWSVEAIDGYSVFWTFRDVRSLSLEIYMRQ